MPGLCVSPCRSTRYEVGGEYTEVLPCVSCGQNCPGYVEEFFVPLCQFCIFLTLYFSKSYEVHKL
jgi:hypothetical protein